MSSMPPGKITYLIEIHCYPYLDQITTLNGSQAASDWTRELQRDELIEPDPCCSPPDDLREPSPFKTTPRGRALIEKWCNTRMPVLVESWL